jgi:hypothetical protein
VKKNVDVSTVVMSDLVLRAQEASLRQFEASRPTVKAEPVESQPPRLVHRILIPTVKGEAKPGTNGTHRPGVIPTLHSKYRRGWTARSPRNTYERLIANENGGKLPPVWQTV